MGKQSGIVFRGSSFNKHKFGRRLVARTTRLLGVEQMEGTLWKKGWASYEKRHVCVEENENGELCLVVRIKTREGKVDTKLPLASLETVDVVNEQTYEFVVAAAGDITLRLRVETRSEFAQWVNGLRAVLGMPDVEFDTVEAPDGSTFAGGLSEAMPPAYPSSTRQPPSREPHIRPSASGGQVAPPASLAAASRPNPPPPAYAVSGSAQPAAPSRPTAPPAYQASSNLAARPPASPGARLPPPSRYPVIGSGGSGVAAARAVASHNPTQPPPPAYSAAGLGYQAGKAMAPPAEPGCHQTAPPRGTAGWPPGILAAGSAAPVEGQVEQTEEEQTEEEQMEEAWLSEVEPEVLEAARELGIRLEVNTPLSPTIP